MMMDMTNDERGGWMMGGMGLLHVLFWILIIAGAVSLVQWLSGRRKEPALDILKRRYAKGKIDSMTFERMKKDISEGEES